MVPGRKPRRPVFSQRGSIDFERVLLANRGDSLGLFMFVILLNDIKFAL